MCYPYIHDTEQTLFRLSFLHRPKWHWSLFQLLFLRLIVMVAYCLVLPLLQDMVISLRMFYIHFLTNIHLFVVSMSNCPVYRKANPRVWQARYCLSSHNSNYWNVIQMSTNWWKQTDLEYLMEIIIKEINWCIYKRTGRNIEESNNL